MNMTATTMPDRNCYALNLNEESVKLCIKNARDKIAEIRAQQEKFQPEYEKEKTFYEQAKAAFDNVNAQWLSLEQDITKQEVVVNALIHFGKSTDPNKKLQTFVKDSDIPAGTSKDMNVKWVLEAEKVLEKENRFMSVEELWNIFEKNPTIVADCNKNKTKMDGMKGIAQNGLIKHALFTNRKKGRQVLSIYKEKIGLFNWLGDAGIPADPKHLEQFVHIGHNGENNVSGTIINHRSREHSLNGRTMLRSAVGR